jgi:hypothetical protein
VASTNSLAELTKDLRGFAGTRGSANQPHGIKVAGQRGRV